MANRRIDTFDIEVFNHLFSSVAEEMGVAVQQSAYSPNIKERLDYSCAVFDRSGNMIAQAAHIPVHLGSMPSSVAAAIKTYGDDEPCAGDVLIVNDPYMGGTHLPDITTVSPVFVGDKTQRAHWGWVATRAHHADMGGLTPGSMPPSTEIYHEGLVIPPIKLVDAGELDTQLVEIICRNVRTPDERLGDLSAQLASHQIGERRISALVDRYGAQTLTEKAKTLLEYTERLARARLRHVPNGVYSFTDFLDDDGVGGDPVPITLTISVDDGTMHFDFSGTAPAVAGSMNAPESITRSAAIYVARCLMGSDVPANEGVAAVLTFEIPSGSLLDPQSPHAVAAGNVETSQRIVDTIWGALAQALPTVVPAASQGTMNNLIIGGHDSFRDKPFTYYETIGGGSGGGPLGPGADGIQIAMTNTRNTPIEALELAYPLLTKRYEMRRGSGGRGKHAGGSGIIREIVSLVPSIATVISERRSRPPWGAAGGSAGRRGINWVTLRGKTRKIPGKTTIALEAGDRVRVDTPGGGGWGPQETSG
jgi:N-methylhydantoinase B